MNETNNDTRPARLYRSRSERMIAGIAGGLAQYLRIDPVLVRIIFVVLTLAGGSGILAYLIAWLVIPEEPIDAEAGEYASPVRSPRKAGRARIVVGLILVAIGIGILAEHTIPWLNDVFWPVALIAAGGGLLYYGASR